MAATTGGLPVGRRSSYSTLRFSGDSESFDDMVFGFLGDGEKPTDCSCDSSDWFDSEDSGDGAEAEEGCDNVEERRKFWEEQEQLLQATLRRTSSIESKIRQVTKEAIKELKLKNPHCICRGWDAGVCRNCIQREVFVHLQASGYNSYNCKSKWKSSPDIPSGDHTYLEVMDRSNAKKGEVRVVIELNFRGEFEMAKASDEYNRLISQLPEVFVGKSERLKALVKILCYAAKKCMKEKKIHMGPWRKHKYMQAKWFGTCQRTAPVPSVEFSECLPRHKASMLTLGLPEKTPAAGFSYSAVEVV